MREIKFRGLMGTTKDRKWVYGHYYRVKSFFSDKEAHYISEIRSDHLQDYVIDEETLGQYTGLHDKNGKEIYEGDIVQHLYWDCDETDYYKVEWDNEILGFVFKSTINNSYLALDDTYSDDTGEYEIVVIGNIYENPELLEE